jgi:hypothetical protein
VIGQSELLWLHETPPGHADIPTVEVTQDGLLAISGCLNSRPHLTSVHLSSRISSFLHVSAIIQGKRDGIMSGLEVVALVVGIVSAFSGTASFLRELKKKRKDKSAHKSERIQRLQKALCLAPPEIQQEYDQDFARIGRRFAVGDGESPGLQAPRSPY